MILTGIKIFSLKFQRRNYLKNSSKIGKSLKLSKNYIFWKKLHGDKFS